MALATLRAQAFRCDVWAGVKCHIVAGYDAFFWNRLSSLADNGKKKKALQNGPASAWKIEDGYRQGSVYPIENERIG
jgi:hypothetical protein